MSAAELSGRALLELPEARRYVYRDENDSSRDEILVDAINDVSEAIWDECEREFRPTTSPDRLGVDGVGVGTTTFTAASGSFTAGDEGDAIYVNGALYEIASVTNGTTVVLDRVLAAGTDLAWDFGEERVFSVGPRGLIDLTPYDLRELMGITLYSDLDTSSQVALGTDDYRLFPRGRSQDGTYLRLRSIAPSLDEVAPGFGWEATIRGQWGMAEVPPVIKVAAKLWVKNIVENPGSYQVASMSGYVVTPELETTTVTRAGMPPAVRHRLARRKRGGLIA